MKVAINTLTMLLCWSCLSAQNRINVSFSSGQPAELLTDAGTDIVSGEQGIMLGGTPAANGGEEPYTFEWIPNTDLNDATISNPILNGDGDYEFTLNVIDARGCSASDNLSVSITYIDDVVVGNDIAIFPNPADRMVTVASDLFQGSENYSISVIGSKGDVIFEEQPQRITGNYFLDISALRVGNYLIFFRSERHNIIGKLIIKN